MLEELRFWLLSATKLRTISCPRCALLGTTMTNYLHGVACRVALQGCIAMAFVVGCELGSLMLLAFLCTQIDHDKGLVDVYLPAAVACCSGSLPQQHLSPEQQYSGCTCERPSLEC